MKPSILALVIVYGQSLEESETLRSLARCSKDRCGLRLLLWDNSPEAKAQVPWDGFDLRGEYVSTPENLPLSVIYNRVIAKWLKEGEHLLILDQDSRIPTDFLSKAVDAITSGAGIGLFLPMVRARGRYVSPVTYASGWGLAWRTPKKGVLSSKHLAAINSGMLISADYLLGDFPGYDERIRFYGTDTQFILDYADRRPTLHMIDAVLDHELSFHSASPSERAGKFRQMKRAYRYIYEGRGGFRRLGVTLVLLLMSIRYAIQNREPGFLGSGEV